MAEKKKKTKGKRKGSGPDRTEAPPYSSIATHPRASLRVRQAKGWGGLAGFALAAALSLKASVPIVQTLERALLAGTIGLLLAWALSVFLWRHLILAEHEAATDELKRRREERAAAEEPAKPVPQVAAESGASSPA